MRRIVLLNLILLLFCAVIKAQGSLVSCPTVKVSATIEGELPKWLKRYYERGTICPGSVVTFTAKVDGLNPSVKPTFKWTISNGEILAGQGASSIEIETPSSGGEVEATVEVNGLPPTLSQCPTRFSKSIDVASCCLIPCSGVMVTAGHISKKDKTFVAHAGLSDPDTEKDVTYEWYIYGGTILEGQGTKTIKVGMSDPESGHCTVTVKVKGLEPECPNTASYTTDIVCPMPSQEQKKESFDESNLAEMKEQLDALAYEMKKNPDTQCYITAHGLSSDKREDIDRKLEPIISYLANNHNITSNRIVIVYSDYRDKFEVEFQIVPLQ
jgi:hypothetical protein